MPKTKKVDLNANSLEVATKRKKIKVETKKDSFEESKNAITEKDDSKQPIKMNKTLKKILVYFAIAGAVIVAALGIYSIRGGVDEEIILRTIATYLVLFFSILTISWVPKIYSRVTSYPELVSIGIWLLTISVAIVGLLICVSIWEAIDVDFTWKIIATIGMINFVMVVSIFAMDKRGSKSLE